jgi:hypothetical protein
MYIPAEVFKSLNSGIFQVKNLHECLIQDFILLMHKMCPHI